MVGDDMAKKPPSQTETPEIDPEKWSQFETTLKRALDIPHKPHKPTKKTGAQRPKSK
jgi:hypothetical protein